ncbi:unnamed protein product [Clonostachys rhizophaga]|uniref:Potassium channel tetramerisation-type BTB domain-containing protein n=1 Tax=Clonostachys rhizophaga TaxID=160324 RepID=A0A9N9UZ95_9HYPO|nr:unnamed protein product [Clonostachys rhizophaga]
MSSVASASVDAGPRPIDPIVLQIGEKKFYTTRQTIAESSVLSSLVHLRDPDPEKPYFVDADPALFEHILRYLRTGIFPLLHDVEKGHDIPLYHALQHQAEFYQIERLANWILARAYLDAVSTKTWPKSVTLHGEQQLAHIDEMIKAAGRTFKILRIDQSRAKAFQCPNRNWRHDGLRSVCINSRCLPPQRASYPLTVEMQVFKVDLVILEVRIHQELVMPVSEQPALPPPYQNTQ